MLAKIKKLLSVTKEERHMMIARHAYHIFHKHQFGRLGRHSAIIHPIMCTGRKYMHIGNDVTIWDGARIECVTSWQGKTYEPKLVIGDGCDIGQNLHLTCGGKIVIEEGVNITAQVMITNINHAFNEKEASPLEKELEIREVKIGKYSFIGHGAKIMPGVKIGRNVIVGAGSVVTKDIEDYCIVVGNPAKVIKKYCRDTDTWMRVEGGNI